MGLGWALIAKTGGPRLPPVKTGSRPLPNGIDVVSITASRERTGAARPIDIGRAPFMIENCRVHFSGPRQTMLQILQHPSQ
jgi:hypothetical protein